MKKKLMSLVLAMAMSLSVLPAANAVNTPKPETESGYSKTYMDSAVFDGIKVSDVGQYAIAASDGSEVPVGMLKVNLLDQEQYSAVMDRADISESVKESLVPKHDQAIDVGKTEQYVFIFSPRLLDNNAAGTYAIPSGRTEYTWNGHKFLIERLYTYNDDSGYVNIQTGVPTKEIAANIFDVTLAIGSLKSEAVSLLASHISLLQAFLNLCNLSNANYVPGHTGDYIQACVTADTCEQWTWGKHLPTDPDWFLGVYTERVFVKKVEARQKYYVSSMSGFVQKDLDPIYPNCELKGTHYTDDWQQACEYAWDNRMSTATDPTPTWKLGNKIFTY